MLRIFSSYLDITNSSTWEKDWFVFRKKFHYFGYTRPQALIFLALGIFALVFPIILKFVYGLIMAPLSGVIYCGIFGIAYIVFVSGMGFGGWFSWEKKIRRNWLAMSNLKKIQGIAFDLEGTIIDIEVFHHSAHLRAAAEIGIDLTKEEAMKRLPHFVGGPDEAIAADIVAFTGNSELEPKFLEATHKYFNDLISKNENMIVAREGIKDFIVWVKEQGLSVSIGTVTTRFLTLYLLKKTGLLELFGKSNIVTNEDVENCKPSSDIYHETAKRMGIDPQQQLVFEDSITGLRSAISAGGYSIAIPSTKDISLLKSFQKIGVNKVFYSWSDPRLWLYVSSLKNNCD